MESSNNDPSPTMIQFASDVEAPARKFGRSEQEVLDEDYRVAIYRTDQSRNYYCQFNSPHHGQRKVSLRTRNYKEAVRRGWEIINQLKNGTIAGRTAAKNFPPDKVVEAYLQELARIGRSPGTVRSYGTCLTLFAEFCAARRLKRLGDLSRTFLLEFENQLRTRGVSFPRAGGKRARTPKVNCDQSIRYKIKVIKAMMHWAVEANFIPDNPIVKYKLPAGSNPRNYCFSVEEVRAICAAAERPCDDIFYLLALTGLRIGELLALTKEDVDLARRVIFVRTKTLPNGQSWTPKSDDRTVPLSLTAFRIAERLVAAVGSPWLFPGSAGSDGGIRRRDVTLQLKRAKAASGVVKGSAHSFRHFFVSRCANAGVSPFKVMRLVGHKSLQIVLTYYHALDEDLYEGVQAVDASMETSTKPTTPT